MNSIRIPRWLIILLALAVIVAVALWLRIALPFPQVFTGQWIKFTGIDAYYYMRLVDNIVHNFPGLTGFDPYYMYPEGGHPDGLPNFFAYLMAGVVWLLSLGNPDQHSVDVISPYIPPIMAALSMIFAFFIGRRLGSVWLGLMAAGLLAILPGELLNRSLLGYTDHHVAEVFFSTLMMLFVFEFVSAAAGRSLGDLKREGVGPLALIIVYGVLAGVVLWLYMLTWQGAMMFAVILMLFQALQAVSEHLRSRSVDYLGLLGICVYGTALVLYLPWMRSEMTAAVLSAGLLLSILLAVFSGFMLLRQLKAFYYPVALAVAGIIGVVALKLILPATFDMLLGLAVGIIGGQPGTTVMEMQPLLWQQGQFTLVVAFGNFMLAFLLSLVGICILVYDVIRNGAAARMLLLICSIFILLATLGMRRFAYYYAVNVSLLSAYVCWLALSPAIGRLSAKLSQDKAIPLATRKKKQKKTVASKRTVVGRQVAVIVLLVLVIVALVYYPNVGPLPSGEKPAIDLATRPLFAPPDYWCEALDWLKANSTEPFGSAGAYYSKYRSPGMQDGFVYPESVYSVITWWDYGYWVSRIGRRVPVSNPGVGNMGEARFFTAQGQDQAAQLVEKWRTRYVIVDHEIARYDGKFHALATLSGGNFTDYCNMAVQKQGDKFVPVILFYPEYYRTMVARLYYFDGLAVEPRNVDVVRLQGRTAQDGQKYNEIVERKQFTSHADAEQYIAQQKTGGYHIVGNKPGQSAVPLESLNEYKLIYKSRQVVTVDGAQVAAIKIFERKISEQMGKTSQ